MVEVQKNLIIIDGNHATLCIICHEYIIHKDSKKELWSRIAHKRCVKLVTALKKRNLKRFAGQCIKYDIPPTQKALIMELVKIRQ